MEEMRMKLDEANKEYKKIEEELISGFSNLINEKFINQIRNVSDKVNISTINTQQDQIRDLNRLIKNIGEVLGVDFGYPGLLDTSISREKYKERVLNLIRNKLSVGVDLKKEQMLTIHIGGEYSFMFKVDKKDYEYYENCKSCHEFEDDDEDYSEFVCFVKKSDLIMSEFFIRYPDKKIDYLNIKDINKFFKDIIKDADISLNIFSKMLESLIPCGSMSYNNTKWL